MGKGKLHELLAVEKGLQTAAEEAIQEARTTFTKKPAHFIGYDKRYEPFDEAAKAEEGTEEHQEMVTTVERKLAFVFKHVAKWFDAVAQKEATNQLAKSDVVIGDFTLVKDVPATLLLGLETKLKQLRVMIRDTPTLAPGIKWDPDENRGKGIYVAAHPEEKFRTKRVVEHKIIVPATPEHPAQVERWTADKNVGRYITEKWCGMLSPAEKSEILGRLDEVERAVKKARQRANSTEVVNLKVGKAITDYVLTGAKQN